METKPTEHQFSLLNSYMFIWPLGGVLNNKPEVIVGFPSFLDSTEITFKFVRYGRWETFSVKTGEIIAVLCRGDGTTEIEGWPNKFRILNEELFKINVEKWIIKLKK